MRRRDRLGARLAVGLAPGLPEPVRRVEAKRILACDHRLAVAGDAAQHGVGKARHRAMPVRRKRHGLGDRRMRRRVQEQQLRRAQPQADCGCSPSAAGSRRSPPAPRRSGPAGAAWWRAAGGRRRDRARSGRRAPDGRRRCRRAAAAGPAPGRARRAPRGALRSLPWRAALRRPAGRSGGRPGPGGSAPRSRPARSRRRTSRSAAPRSGRAGSRTGS